MTLEFREAQAADAEPVRALVRAAYAPYLARMQREPAPMTADYAALIAAGRVTLALDAERLVGALVCYPRGDSLHVENVAVDPARHGAGIGRALMACAEAEARARGLGAVELYTNEVMTENVPFYAALGYDVVGQGQEAGYRRIFFRKTLSAD